MVLGIDESQTLGTAPSTIPSASERKAIEETLERGEQKKEWKRIATCKPYFRWEEAKTTFWENLAIKASSIRRIQGKMS